MNQSPIWSVPASATNLVPFRRVKIGATGALYAGIADGCVGTLLPGDPGDDKMAAIQDLYHGVHFATVDGVGIAIAVGDELESAINGKVTRKVVGIVVAVALEAATVVGQADDLIRVKYVQKPV